MTPETAAGRARVGCDAVRWQGVTTLRVQSGVEQEYRRRTVARESVQFALDVIAREHGPRGFASTPFAEPARQGAAAVGLEVRDRPCRHEVEPERRRDLIKDFGRRAMAGLQPCTIRRQVQSQYRSKAGTRELRQACNVAEDPFAFGRDDGVKVLVCSREKRQIEQGRARGRSAEDNRAARPLPLDAPRHLDHAGHRPYVDGQSDEVGIEAHDRVDVGVGIGFSEIH